MNPDSKLGQVPQGSRNLLPPIFVTRNGATIYLAMINSESNEPTSYNLRFAHQTHSS